MNSSYDERVAKITADREAQLALSVPYKPGKFTPGNFSIIQRDTHHFDIYAERRPGYVQWYYKKNPDSVSHPMKDGGSERAFAIRGEPGDIYLRDERWDQERPSPRDSLRFNSVEEAMMFVVSELMIV